MLSRNQKGAIAEMEIATAATKLGVPVLRPVAEHSRYDLGFEIGPELLRVQCKWGRLGDGVVIVNLTTSRRGPNGHIRTTYTTDEIDLVAVYCGELDRCYLLLAAKIDGMRSISLRVNPPKNAQRGCINLAEDFEFNGAVAQLAERGRGTSEARGSNPLSSTPTPRSDDGPDTHIVGSNRFRNHLGYYLDRAAEGDRIEVTRHGKPFARLISVPTRTPRLPLLDPPTAATPSDHA